MNTLLFLITLILFTIMIARIYFFKKIRKESFQIKEKELPKVDRPFVNLYDDKGNHLNVTLFSRPFYKKEHREDYNSKVKPNFLVLGISSYQEFPNEPVNPKDGYNSTTNIYNNKEWLDMCSGWLHCFRDPENYFEPSMKTLLLSESDFTDCHINKPNPEVKKKYDFLYICHRDDLSDCSPQEWVAYNKNLELAQKCLSVLCKKKKLKGLLIGRSGCDLPKGCDKIQMETTDKLDYHDLQKKYDECKIIFLPNVHDASPRVLTESLCHDLRCIVNKKLVGGWKYVNEQTGEFFTDENDFEEKIDKILNNYDSYQPRKYFTDNYGILKAGKKLKDFIFNIFGDKVNIPREKIKYITPEFKKENYKSCV